MVLIDALDRLGTKLFVWPVDPNLPTDEEGFRARCHERFDAHARLLTGTLLCVMIVFLPADLLLMRQIPHAMSEFGKWRTAAFIIAIGYLLLPRWKPIARHIDLIGGLALGGSFFIAGHALAFIGGPESPFIHFCYMFPFASIALPLSFSRRLVFTAFISACPIGGVLLNFPEHRASPYMLLMCAQMLGSFGMSQIFGHLLLVLLRQNFFQAQELSRHAKALTAHSDQLEERVAEQTRELRYLITHVEKAQEAERTRIARDLHDALGQELSALRYALNYTQTRYVADPTAIGPNLDELADLLLRTATTMREIMAELRPRILDDLGLTAAAQWLVERVKKSSALFCELRVLGDVTSVDGEHRTAAFRILQEALTNVVRHARAKRAEVLLTIEKQGLELRILDDGIGMQLPIKRSAAPSGMGLLGMRERAGALGGKLEVVTRPEGGTEVHCRLPLPLSSGAVA